MRLLEAIGSAGAQPGILPAPAEVQSRLQPGEVLVEFFVIGDELVRFRLEREPTISVTRRPAPGLASEARQWRREPAGSLAPQRPAVLSAALFGDLPLERTTGLFLAPDGALNELPFDLLDTSRGRLADSVVWHLLPSGAMLRAASPAPRSPVHLVGVSDPELAADLALPPLPNARAEVETAARRLGGTHTVLIGADATPSRLLAAAREGTQVLHVATHTLAEEGGGEIGIPLTPDADFADGLLRPRDLVGQSLHVDLTVLAACSSGRSGADASGVGTLSGALLGAGSRAVIATLWDVDDAASAALMEQLYWELDRGRPPSIALARAKARVRSTPGWSDPRHWAGFVLIGDCPPIGAGPQPWIPVGLAAVALLGLTLWLRRRG